MFRLYIFLSLIMFSQKIFAVEWVLQSQAPKKNPDYKAVEDFAENIKTTTNGRLIIKTYPGDSKERFAKGGGLYSAVRHNKVQMVIGWPNWWHNVNSAWNALQSGPYGHMNLDSSMMWFFVGKGTEFANQLSEPHGIIWRPAWWAGMELGLLTKKGINSLADLKNKIIRIGPGIPNETLKKAAPGVRTNTIPSSDIGRAFASGNIHGIEWTVPSATYAMGFHKKEGGGADHIIVPAVWQPSVLGDFLINKKSFDSLSPDIQAILETAMKAFALTTTLNGKVQDMEALKNFKESGVTVSSWSEEDLKTWYKEAIQVYEEHKKKSKKFKEIYEDKMKFKKKYQDYYKTHGPYE